MNDYFSSGLANTMNDYFSSGLANTMNDYFSSGLANTMNDNFSSGLIYEQLNNMINIKQFEEYEGNTRDTLNLFVEEVQEKLKRLNIYKSTRPDLLHPNIHYTLELRNWDNTWRLENSKCNVMQFRRRETWRNLEITDQLLVSLLWIAFYMTI